MVTRYRGHQYHYTSHCQAPITTQGILTSLMAGPSTFPPGSANPFAGPADRPAEIARLRLLADHYAQLAKAFHAKADRLQREHDNGGR
jgi:hypothetical protein